MLSQRPRAVSAAQPLLTWPLIAAVSCGGGIVASAAAPAAALAIAGLCVGILAVAYVRRLVLRQESLSQAVVAVAPPAAASLVPVESSREMSERDLGLRIARLSYYGGMLFIGELVIRPVKSLTLSDWLFFFAISAAAVAFAHRQDKFEVRLPPLVLLGIGVFAIGGLLSSFASELPSQSIAVILRLCYVTVVWFWLGTLVLRRVEHVRTAAVLWVTSAAFNGVGAILQYFKGDVISGGQVNWGRVSGLTQNVSDLGGVTCAALVPALLFLVSRRAGRTRRVTALSASVVGLIGAGLILSGSVGSLAAAALSVAFWFGSQRTRARRLLVLGGVACAFLAILSTHTPRYSQSVFDRISRFGSGAPSDPNRTFDSRIAGYKIALARIERDPFIGVGLDSESNRAGKLPVHDIILGTWFSTGILGLTGVVLIWIGIARAASSALREAPDADERALVLALSASFLAFLVFVLSEPALFSRYGWVSAALLLALRAIQARRKGAVACPSQPSSMAVARG